MVLGDARLEPRVYAHQFADDLLALSLRVALQRQHLGCLQKRLDLVLRFLTDAHSAHIILHFGVTQHTRHASASRVALSEVAGQRWLVREVAGL